MRTYDEEDHHETKVTSVRLERTLVRQVISGEALSLHSVVESEVGRQDEHPSDESGLEKKRTK